MCISCFRPGGSHCPKRPSLLGENQALGYSLLLTWLHISASYQSRFFGSYRTRGTRTGSSSSPEGHPPSYGYNHSPTKIQPLLYGQNRALSHTLRKVLVVRTQNKKAEMGRENSSGEGQRFTFQLSSKHERQQGQRDRSYRTAQSQMGGPPCSARYWQHHAGVCRHPGPWCSPPHPQPVAAWQRHNSPGYMPHAALSSLEIDT